MSIGLFAGISQSVQGLPSHDLTDGTWDRWHERVTGESTPL
jgi:hypothetical protein